MRQTANSVLQDPTEPRSLPYHASMFPGSSPDDPFMIALQNAVEENAMKRMGWIGTALLLTWTAYGQERLAIVGATIVDGNGGAPIASGTIIIDGERIAAVGRSDTAAPPTRAQSMGAASSLHLDSSTPMSTSRFMAATRRSATRRSSAITIARKTSFSKPRSSISRSGSPRCATATVSCLLSSRYATKSPAGTRSARAWPWRATSSAGAGRSRCKPARGHHEHTEATPRHPERAARRDRSTPNQAGVLSLRVTVQFFRR